jgi:hypothetical protein
VCSEVFRGLVYNSMFVEYFWMKNGLIHSGGAILCHLEMILKISVLDLYGKIEVDNLKNDFHTDDGDTFNSTFIQKK